MNEIIVATPQQIKAYIAEALNDIIAKGDFSKTVVNPPKKYLGFEEAAKYLGIAHSTLYRYNSDRVIEYFNRGRKLYYQQSDLDNFILKYRKATALEEANLMRQKMQLSKK